MANKVLVADYGMNVYYGGLFDLETRLTDLQGIGYDGLERLSAPTEAALLEAAALHRRLGTTFSTVRGPSLDISIRWSAALWCSYVWVEAPARDLDAFCRQALCQAAAAERWGLWVAVHNHMWTPVETEPEVRHMLDSCPTVGLILDTAHLAAIGGDPVAMVHDYADRIVQVHVKDWIAEGVDESGHTAGRFCELGAGNIGLDNVAVLAALRQVGYEGPIAVEQDTHIADPLVELEHSRGVLREAGF